MLERVQTTLRFAACVGQMGVHASVAICAFIVAVSKTFSGKIKNL